MDDKNLAARPEIEENESVRWLAETFEAHNPWVRKNYVLAYAQVFRPSVDIFGVHFPSVVSASRVNYQLFNHPINSETCAFVA